MRPLETKVGGFQTTEPIPAPSPTISVTTGIHQNLPSETRSFRSRKEEAGGSSIASPTALGRAEKEEGGGAESSIGITVAVGRAGEAEAGGGEGSFKSGTASCRPSRREEGEAGGVATSFGPTIALGGTEV